MILPFLQSGTTHSQDIGVRSLINHIQPGDQSHSPSSFFHLLNQTQSNGTHDPFPRQLVEQPDGTSGLNSQDSSIQRSSLEERTQDDNQMSEEQKRTKQNQDSVQLSQIDQTDDSKKSRIAQESKEEKIQTLSKGDQESKFKLNSDTQEQTVGGEEVLNQLVFDPELGKPAESTDGVLTEQDRKESQYLDLQADVTKSALIEEKASISKTKNLEESQEGKSIKETASFHDLNQGSLAVNEQNRSAIEQNDKLSITTDTNQNSNLDLSQHTKVTEQLKSGEHTQDSLGSNSQVIQVVDLRTKQRTTGKNQNPNLQVEPGVTVSKTQVLRELRALQERENLSSTPVQRNIQSTFGIISDLNQSSFRGDISAVGTVNDGVRTQLTLGSESFFRFLDYKSNKPWTQTIHRLFGRDLNSSESILGLTSGANRSSSVESSQVQQQLMVHHQLQEQTKSVMSPSSADQAQVSTYLRTAGNAEILKSAKFILKDHDKGEIKLILKPERLGEIKIQLSLSNNSIEAQILVDNKEVEEALRENLEALMAAFQEQGFDIGDFSVTTRESKLASLLIQEPSMIQISGQETKWVDQEAYGQDKIHIDLAI